jgi:hypothetical protein
MTMEILNLPGNLGPARGSFLTILHYNWPAYPIGDGYIEPLLSFSLFPAGTDFIEIDNGDGSLLVAAKIKGLNDRNLYDDKNFHICAWHSDLLEMNDLDLIAGVKSANDFEIELDRWNKMVKKIGTDQLFSEVNGQMQKINPPSRNEDLDDENDFRCLAIVPESTIRLDPKAFLYVRERVSELSCDFITDISPVVRSLYDSGHHEPAVRQAVVTLEDSIKGHLGSTRFGARLGEEFIQYLRNETNILESSIRSYSQELRMVYKFIRNVYAHNIVQIDETGALVLLLRIYRVLSMLRNGNLT